MTTLTGQVYESRANPGLDLGYHSVDALWSDVSALLGGGLASFATADISEGRDWGVGEGD